MTIIVGTSTLPATTQAAQPSSGTYNFDPALSDLTLEAFARIQLKTAAITAEHMWNCRMSANLLLSSWSNRVPCLWLVQQLSIPLIQGVATYSIPSNVVTILDSFIRQFQLGNTVNLPVAFTTALNSITVSINWPAHNQIVGNWIAVQVPIAVGGIVIQGNYQVSNVLDSANLEIVNSTAATSAVVAGGAVPLFTSSAGSSTITVTLPNHGYSVGSNFSVQVETIVGNVTIGASLYSVVSVVSSSQFTFTANGVATTSASAQENGGLSFFQSQVTNYSPYDRVTTPISRTDYSNQANKETQAFPSTYWFNRQINPTVTFWSVPDQNGPYVFNYYAMVQPQDAVMANGKTMDMPYRFYDAFAAGLARRLARKYAPALTQELAIEESIAWEEASSQDTENTPMYLTPVMSGYYR
jgi:hypothetical protein